MLVEGASPSDWFIAGSTMEDRNLATFYVEVSITEGINSRDETSAYLRGVFIELERLIGPGGETRTERYRTEVNEQGEAPVLEHNGLRLSQSGVILDYLAKTTGQFGPRSDEEAREIWRWVLFDNHKFTSYYATLRFMVMVKKSGETPVTAFLRERALGAYGVVDRHLADKDFMLGDRPTIADFACRLCIHARTYRHRPSPVRSHRSLEGAAQRLAWLEASLRYSSGSDIALAGSPADRREPSHQSTDR